MKGLIAAILVLAGIFWAYLTDAVIAVITAFVFGFLLDPFLAILNVPYLTERFSGLGFGDLFILVFTVKLIIGVLIPVRANTENGGGK
jgi:uncharacterized membrane protein YczE